MRSVLLADSFSLDEAGCFGRAVANRSLLRALIKCNTVSNVLIIGDKTLLKGVDKEIGKKVILLNSFIEVEECFEKYNVAAIIASDFASSYGNWIDYRNERELDLPVIAFTHSLSYQRFTSSIYKILCASPAPSDYILCTSDCALNVMSNLFEKVMKTINFSSQVPVLKKFPLPYECGENVSSVDRDDNIFRVLFIGRLDWQTKADLFILKSIMRRLDNRKDVRFTMAGAPDNPLYIELLKKELGPLGVEIITELDEEKKEELYGKSHIFLSPSDNYQETFGLTVLEAKHFGCVPIVSDFDGYRELVEDGRDGMLVKTIAAPIPSDLMRSQCLVNEAVYHGWWAGGVGIDPEHVVRAIIDLKDNKDKWREMSAAAAESIGQYSIESASGRFKALFDEFNGVKTGNRELRTEYPFKWNFLKIFNSHPSAIWKDQKVRLTPEGEAYLKKPYMLPQFLLFSMKISADDIRKALFLIKRGYGVEECIKRFVEPVCFSISLKNGLITIE